jgi:uncharacterized protein (DUF433 family)
LQEIRRLVAYLRGEGLQRPLRELRWATEGGRLYFQSVDGSWYESRRPTQGVIADVLDLEDIRAQLSAATARPAGARGRTERRTGVLGGQEVVAGTRIPVATVERWIARGHSDGRILEAYPDLDEQDVMGIRARMSRPVSEPA